MGEKDPKNEDDCGPLFLCPSHCKTRIREDFVDEADGPVSRCLILKDKIDALMALFCVAASIITLVHQYATLQRMQLTQGVAFPMSMEGTCVCDSKLCPHVLFTFNTTIPRDNYDWTNPTGTWPTYHDAWHMTRLSVPRAHNSTDVALTGCPPTGEEGNRHHKPELCTEHGIVDKDGDCCALPNTGGCLYSDAGVGVETVIVPGTSLYGTCGKDGKGVYTCCMEGKDHENKRKNPNTTFEVLDPNSAHVMMVAEGGGEERCVLDSEGVESGEGHAVECCHPMADHMDAGSGRTQMGCKRTKTWQEAFDYCMNGTPWPPECDTTKVKYSCCCGRKEVGNVPLTMLNFVLCLICSSAKRRPKKGTCVIQPNLVH